MGFLVSRLISQGYMLILDMKHFGFQFGGIDFRLDNLQLFNVQQGVICFPCHVRVLRPYSSSLLHSAQPYEFHVALPSLPLLQNKREPLRDAIFTILLVSHNVLTSILNFSNLLGTLPLAHSTHVSRHCSLCYKVHSLYSSSLSTLLVFLSLPIHSTAALPVHFLRDNCASSRRHSLFLTHSFGSHVACHTYVVQVVARSYTVHIHHQL